MTAKPKASQARTFPMGLIATTILITQLALNESGICAEDSVINGTAVIEKKGDGSTPPLDFESKRKGLETKIAALEKFGVNAKPYHQALAEVAELSNSQSDSKVIDDRLERINRSIDEQLEEISYRVRLKNLGPFKPAKISPPSPVELYSEKLQAVLRKAWKLPVKSNQHTCASVTIDATGKIANVKVHDHSKGNAATRASFQAFLSGQKSLPAPPAGIAPVTLVVSQSVADKIDVLHTNVEVDFSKYMAAVQNRIRKGWHPPKGEESKRITVFFSLNRAGEILSRKIVPPGNPAADAAALRAVEVSAPFGPLPAGAPRSVDVEFTFDYNVWRKQKRQ